MENRIAQALKKLFERHRIVFWFDTKEELWSDFDSLELDGVEKIRIDNNEFGVKYRILREQLKQKFLIYRDGAQPPDLENWLLDVQLAHGEFRTDQVAIWLSELELGPEFMHVVSDHVEFFRAIKRKEGLKKLLKSDDTVGKIRLKMLAVCTGSEPRMDAVLETLLQELAEEREEKIKLVGRCGLGDYFWEQMSRCYGYKSDEPGIEDFAITLFKFCYFMGVGDDDCVKLSDDALVFLKRCKDSRQFESGFEKLSTKCVEILAKTSDGILTIKDDLEKRDLSALIELDYFHLIDEKIIKDLVREVVLRTVSSDNVLGWVHRRRQCHWYRKYRHEYEAIDYAAQFQEMLTVVGSQWSEQATCDWTLANWVQQYAETWYKLDHFYRKFIYHVRESGQATLMDDLLNLIENLYSNSYLLKLGDRFQTVVAAASKWEASPVCKQRDFFEHWIRPFLRKDNKVCVIISDAMRYEIGDELLSLVRQEDRYSAELEPALSMLPSYTQLGMAALLPNENLEIVDDKTVLVDGKSSQGIPNRGKILGSGMPGKNATVLKAEDFLKMPRDGESGYRSLFSSNDVVYIYHDMIDAVGDKRGSEDRVFGAVEESLSELLKIIRKLSTANATNMLVTSDHGFIYQNRALDESDFSGCDAAGEQILLQGRRFVLGKGLKENPSLHKFTSDQLGLAGKVEVQIPKSINRLRQKGSGNRYVHGGATLQEVVIPVLKINKKRQSDVSVVEVDILRGANLVITSGQLAVTMYQAGPVTDKIKPRLLRAGIYTEAGDLISDSHELTFNLSSDNPRDREFSVRFVLTRKADEVNGQEVILRLEERHIGTSHFKEYKSLRYTMRRSFTSDFDF